MWTIKMVYKNGKFLVPIRSRGGNDGYKISSKPALFKTEAEADAATDDIGILMTSNAENLKSEIASYVNEMRLQGKKLGKLDAQIEATGKLPWHEVRFTMDTLIKKRERIAENIRYIKVQQYNYASRALKKLNRDMAQVVRIVRI